MTRFAIALISLAAQRIAMTDGGTIGAATPVQIGQTGSAPSPVDEKTVSYVRKEFRATAESRKRPLLIAEAMVDSDVEIPGLVAKGKLLTLSTEEALTHGVADFRANNMDADRWTVYGCGRNGCLYRYANCYSICKTICGQPCVYGKSNQPRRMLC